MCEIDGVCTVAGDRYDRLRDRSIESIESIDSIDSIIRPVRSIIGPVGDQKTAENFKWPKNREDRSDLDENLTESIAAMKTIISKRFLGRFRRKTSRKLRESVVDGVGGCAVSAEQFSD